MRLLFILYAIVAIVLIAEASRNKPSNKPSKRLKSARMPPKRTRYKLLNRGRRGGC